MNWLLLNKILGGIVIMKLIDILNISLEEATRLAKEEGLFFIIGDGKLKGFTK